MSLEKILFESPWISYNDKFIQSRITLTYPENVIFTAQFLKHAMDSDVYKRYPYAEKMDVSAFQGVDWSKAIVVFDHESNLILAPDPVHRLVRLDRRLRHKEAVDRVFDPFRFLPFLESFRGTEIKIFIIVLFYALYQLYALRYRVGFLTLSSKILNG